MKFKDNVNFLSSSTSWIFTIIQTNELLQMICFILSIVSTAFTIAYTIYRWYNKSKADGKITIDEIKNLKDDLDDDIENFYKNLPKKEDKNE